VCEKGTKEEQSTPKGEQRNNLEEKNRPRHGRKGAPLTKGSLRKKGAGGKMMEKKNHDHRLYLGELM